MCESELVVVGRFGFSLPVHTHQEYTAATPALFLAARMTPNSFMRGSAATSSAQCGGGGQGNVARHCHHPTTPSLPSRLHCLHTTTLLRYSLRHIHPVSARPSRGSLPQCLSATQVSGAECFSQHSPATAPARSAAPMAALNGSQHSTLVVWQVL